MIFIKIYFGRKVFHICVYTAICTGPVLTFRIRTQFIVHASQRKGVLQRSVFALSCVSVACGFGYVRLQVLLSLISEWHILAVSAHSLVFIGVVPRESISI